MILFKIIPNAINTDILPSFGNTYTIIAEVPACREQRNLLVLATEYQSTISNFIQYIKNNIGKEINVLGTNDYSSVFPKIVQ